MKTILGIKVSDSEFDNYMLQQEQGQEIVANNGKLFLKPKPYYVVKNNELIIDKELLINQVQHFIDNKLDKLQLNLIKNETYSYLPTYQQIKEQKQKEIQEQRILRQNLNSLNLEQLEAING